MQMKLRILVVLGVIASMLLVGCGKAAGEKAAEGLVNSLLEGSGIEVDTKSESITFTNEDGTETNWSVAEEGQIPAGFVLPVFPGMKTDGFVETRSGGELGWIGTLYFDGDIEAIATQYEQALRDLGLDPGMMSVTDENGFSAVYFASGEIGGKHYGGILTMGTDEEPHPLGKHYLAVMFGEQEPDN